MAVAVAGTGTIHSPSHQGAKVDWQNAVLSNLFTSGQGLGGAAQYNLLMLKLIFPRNILIDPPRTILVVDPRSNLVTA